MLCHGSFFQAGRGWGWGEKVARFRTRRSRQSGPGAHTHLQLIAAFLGGQTATTRSIHSVGRSCVTLGHACGRVYLPLTPRSHAWALWPRTSQLGSSPHGKVGPGGAGGPPGGEDSHGAILWSGKLPVSEVSEPLRPELPGP